MRPPVELVRAGREYNDLCPTKPTNNPLRINAIRVHRKVSEAGATLAEYAVIVAVLAVTALSGMALIGETLNDRYASTASEISDADGSGLSDDSGGGGSGSSGGGGTGSGGAGT